MHALAFSLAPSALFASWLGSAWGVSMAVVALGVVIFVHELGHFLAARACGVKCEKFYVGFDFFGISLWKKKWGDTVYGIGSFPLGGYVKMLGQDDNPAAIAKEAERSKAASSADSATESDSAGSPATPGESSAAESSASESTAPEASQLDPQSYLAKSVPQRMLIISAGVIFNLLSGAVFAAIAYGLGVEYNPCIVGGMMPGEAAWQAGLRPGDVIVQIGEEPMEQPLEFRDLQSKVVLGGSSTELRFRVRRGDETIDYMLRPKREETAGRPLIGVISPMEAKFVDQLPVDPSSAAYGAVELAGGERIVAADGRPVARAADVYAALAANRDRPLTMTLRADGESDGESGEERQIVVPPNPRKRFGLRMTMGPITAIRADSVAERAGLLPGDVLVRVDGKPISDPILLDDLLRRSIGQETAIEARRGEEAIQATVVPEEDDWFDRVQTRNDPSTALCLGIAFAVEPTVAAVTPGSPAEAAGFQPGDRILAVESNRQAAPDSAFPEIADGLLEQLKYDFTDESAPESWTGFLLGRVQQTMPGREFSFRVARGDDEVDVASSWRLAEGEFEAERGLQLTSLIETRTAASPLAAIGLGVRETVDQVVMTARFVKKLFEKDGVSPKNLGGPGTIFVAASASAQRGASSLLMFLTLISANLAVLNIMPVPVLDGGHLVFLAYEGVFRRPPSEKIMIALSYVGLAMVLFLMIYATSRDVSRFLDWLSPR